MNNNRDFFSIARAGDIISMRSDGFVGKLIRWVTASNINHVAIYIGNGLIIESALGHGVRIIPLEIYLNDPSEEVHISRVKGKFDCERIINFSYRFHGAKYNLLGQFGILVKHMAKRARLNKLITFWGENRLNYDGFWCSEFVGIVFSREYIKFSDDDTSYLTPSEIFDNTEEISWQQINLK